MTRFVIDYDHEAAFEECNGQRRPLTELEYADAQYWQNDQPVSYPDYLAYYGNPDRHVYLSIRRQDRCPHCGTWITTDSLGGLDFMDDQPEASFIGTYTLDQLPGYLHDVAQDLEGMDKSC